MSASKNRTLLGDDILIEAKDTFTSIATALDEVIYGTASMTEACKNNGLDYHDVRRILLSKSFADCALKHPLKMLEDAVSIEPSGYEKLYQDVFGIDDIGEIEMPPDYKQTVLDVLQSLTEREWKILDMRYGIGGCESGEPMTLEEVGKKFGVTSNRIRQIENKALRKLRHPIRAQQLKWGSTRYYAEQQAHDAEIKAHKESVNLWLEEQIRAAEESAKNPVPLEELDPASIDINTLELSVRSYNCLRRANINTLQDLLNVSDEQLMKVRNLGRRSLEEVKAKRDEWLADIVMRQKIKLEQEGKEDARKH